MPDERREGKVEDGAVSVRVAKTLGSWRPAEARGPQGCWAHDECLASEE